MAELGGGRLIRGLAALLVLLVGLLGVPVALVVLGGNPLPTDWSWPALTRALLQPDDGRVLVGLITVVGWLAWLAFAVSVLTEAVSLASRHRRLVHLPGLGAAQRLAGSLLLAAVALASPARAAHAEPAPPPVAVSAPAPTTYEAPQPERTSPAARPLSRPTADPAAVPVNTVVHVVVPGDDLWSLAERYYRDGPSWRKIAQANRHVLTGGPDRLERGWRLAIPDVVSGAGEDQTVIVRQGDTLSAIAQRELGEAIRWPELFAANRDVLDDPDELAVGTRLHLPTAGLRHPAPGAQPAGHEQAPAPHDPRPPRDQSRSSTKQVEQPPTGDGPVAAPDSTKPPHPPAPSATGGGGDIQAPRAEAPASAAASGSRSASAAASGSRSASAAASGSTPPSGATSAPTAAGPGHSSVPTHSSPSTSIPATGEGAEPHARAEPAGAPHVSPSVAGLAGVGGLLAAGLVAGLAVRRRIQLHARPVGRRIAHPDPPLIAEESTLGARSRPLSLGTLDLALRAIAVHCLAEQAPVPALLLAAVDADQIELIMAEAAGQAPLGFRVDGSSWLLAPSDAEYLETVPGIGEAVRPYPSLVSLGTDRRGRMVLVNIEGLGMLTLPDTELAGDVLAAMAVELSLSPWADEMILTLVGDRAGLPEALGKHNVTAAEDVEALLDRLVARAAMQRAHRPEGPAGRFRIDPDLSDPWAPEIVLITRPLTEAQQRRLADLIDAEPRPTIAAVVAGPVTGATWILRQQGTEAELAPLGLRLTPQGLAAAGERAVVSLVAATGSAETAPAPWWANEHGPPDSPPDNVAYLGRRFGGWTPAHTDDESEGTMAEDRGQAPGERPHAPVLALLGEVVLLGARGEAPPRASKQCLEYCGWLLEHPGTTAQAMGSALAVAEGTRRSNMSRLRSWLGTSPQGDAYLPDAYSGRIFLHPDVSSDWQRLQILIAGGVNRTGDERLRAALALVRGAPLADAAPGQWHWAEELRTDMISVVRDIGVELANRALDAGNLDLARWAAARAMVTAPGDELLTGVRIRTEHLAGNDGETERLTLQLARQARTLGLDLDPSTVDLLQQVMEGGVRARLA